MHSSLNAQDTEFSQFYAAPVYMNPSMIGFSEAPRVTVNFRDQLPSFSHAFVTAAVSYDQHFYDLKSSLGLTIVADIAGNLLNTYQLHGVYAYQLPLGQNMQLKAGVNFGVIQQSINQSNLIFRDMINPNAVTDNVSLPTEETPFARTNLTKFDLGGGFTLFNNSFFAGASFKHLTTPSLSFTDSDDDENELEIRTSVHIGNTFYLNDPFFDKDLVYIAPTFMVAHQGDFLQLVGGAYFGRGPIFGGLSFRHTIQNSDALIAMFGFRKGIFKVGYSYDFDVGKVQTNAGAHELSLSFDLGEDPYQKKKVRMRESIKCPTMFQ